MGGGHATATQTAVFFGLQFRDCHVSASPLLLFRTRQAFDLFRTLVYNSVGPKVCSIPSRPITPMMENQMQKEFRVDRV